MGRRFWEVGRLQVMGKLIPILIQYSTRPSLPHQHLLIDGACFHSWFIPDRIPAELFALSPFESFAFSFSLPHTHSQSQYSFPISVTSTSTRLNFGQSKVSPSCSCRLLSLLSLIRMLTGFTVSAFSTLGDTLCTHVIHFHNLLRVGSVAQCVLVKGQHLFSLSLSLFALGVSLHLSGSQIFVFKWPTACV